MLDNLARIRVDLQDANGKSHSPDPTEKILRFPSSIQGAGNIGAAIELVNEAIAEMRRIEKRAQETEQYAQAVAGKAVESLRIAQERILQLEAERNSWEAYINQAIVMTREAASALTMERARFTDAEEKIHQLEVRIEAFGAIANEGVDAVVRLKDEILAQLSRRDTEPKYKESLAAE